MSSPDPLPPPPAPPPDGGDATPTSHASASREWRYIVSMDLGSDSTVVYVEDRSDGNPKDPVAVELQRFLPVLADDPLLLKDANGGEYRLKSRYVATANCRLAMVPVPRTTPRGYPEILPRKHAKTRLVDFEAYYSARQSGATSLNPRQFENTLNKRSVVFQLVFDTSEGFDISAILPNAKLVFQTGAELPTFKVTLPDNKEQFLDNVTPLELIKNQVCLILENFVRFSPPLTRNGRFASWSECLLYLTVPNTYSPRQREEIGHAVADELGCTVRTITESDAVVFHYYDKKEPNQGLTDEDLRGLIQQYLTIDIGKGTTDVTLLSMTRKPIADPTERTRRRVEPDQDVNHVAVIARSGRASGGALLTYHLAEYLERVVDVAVTEALADLLRAEPPHARSPMRFTRRTPPDIGTVDTRRDNLLRFESICERHKREIVPAMDGAEETYPFVPIVGDAYEIDALAGFVGDLVRDVGEARGQFQSASGADVAQAVRATVARALRDPESFRRSSHHRDRLDGPWRDLQKKIQNYVKENVDGVLLDIARATCNPEILDRLARLQAEGRRGVGTEALMAICGTAERRPHAGLPPDCIPRTHVILSGQGSQFKPILLYLQTVIGRRMDFLDDQDRPLSTGPLPAVAPPPVSLIERIRRFLMGLLGGKERPSAASRRGSRDRAVVLTGAYLKDACANGALQWHRANPVVVNPDYIHGQFIVTRHGGGVPFCVPMDELNASGPAGYRYAMGGPVAPRVYYVPSRLDSVPPDWKPKGRAEAQFDECRSLLFTVSRDVNGGGVVDIRDEDGHRQVGGGGVYGSDDLYPMLWPAQLKAEEGAS